MMIKDILKIDDHNLQIQLSCDKLGWNLIQIEKSKSTCLMCTLFFLNNNKKRINISFLLAKIFPVC